jgi:ATP-dependent DNA ligase
MIEAVRVQGLEGVVAKRLDSVYESGQRSAELVVRCFGSAEDFLEFS